MKPLVTQVFTPSLLAELAEAYEVDTEQFVWSWQAVPDERLAEVEVVVTGWGAPTVGDAVLDRMPKLRAVCHAAGTVKSLVRRRVLERGVVVTSAAFANAEPVAQYTLAAVISAAKMIGQAAARYRSERADVASFALAAANSEAGLYGTTIGIVSASTIGRRVIELLRPLEVEVLLYDPFVSESDAAQLGATKVDLDDLFRRSRVVSLHAPDLPSTRGMITRALLESMPEGATFVNTARPLIVDSDGLRAVLASGRINAVLDVTDPEPLPADDTLWDMPNVTLTPHWAGSVGREQGRLGRAAVDEALRIARGEAPLHPVTLDRWDIMA